MTDKDESSKRFKLNAALLYFDCDAVAMDNEGFIWIADQHGERELTAAEQADLETWIAADLETWIANAPAPEKSSADPDVDFIKDIENMIDYYDERRTDAKRNNAD